MPPTPTPTTLYLDNHNSNNPYTHRPPTDHPQTPTDTLIPTPYASNPYTLNPEPRQPQFKPTIHPQTTHRHLHPDTLHPQPYTLNPTPRQPQLKQPIHPQTAHRHLHPDTVRPPNPYTFTTLRLDNHNSNNPYTHRHLQTPTDTLIPTPDALNPLHPQPYTQTTNIETTHTPIHPYTHRPHTDTYAPTPYAPNPYTLNPTPGQPQFKPPIHVLNSKVFETVCPDGQRWLQFPLRGSGARPRTKMIDSGARSRSSDLWVMSPTR